MKCSAPELDAEHFYPTDIWRQTMISDKTIGVIGAGAMGGALCRGLVHGGAAKAESIYVSDPHAAHIEALRASLGVNVAADNQEAARSADILILAVKPYNVSRVLDEMAGALTRDSGTEMPLLISIAAGYPIAKLEAHCGDSVPVIRAMPNTPAQVGQGACAFCRGTYALDEHAEQARE